MTNPADFGSLREDMQTILSLIVGVGVFLDGAPEAVKAWHRVAGVLETKEATADEIVAALWADLADRSGFDELCGDVQNDEPVWKELKATWASIIVTRQVLADAPFEDVIKGIQLHVPAAEVRSMASAAHKHHLERAAVYDKQVGEMKGAGEEENRNVSSDLLTSARRRAQEHHDKARFFLFLANHIPDGRMYELSATDLRTLGVTDQHYGF